MELSEMRVFYHVTGPDKKFGCRLVEGFRV